MTHAEARAKLDDLIAKAKVLVQVYKDVNVANAAEVARQRHELGLDPMPPKRDEQGDGI